MAKLGARQRLMAASASKDEPLELILGLDGLRRSGDAPSLTLAVNHLRQVGPLDAAVTAVRMITQRSWTHTAAKANLSLFELAGDLLEPEAADGWVKWCVDLMADSALADSELVRPTFLVDFALAEAIAGMLSAAGPSGRGRAVEFLAAQPSPIDSVMVRPFSGWIRQFDGPDVSEDLRIQLQAQARREPGQIGARLLGWLADHGEESAREEILDRALDGDLYALSELGDVNVLTSAEARKLIERFASMVRGTIDQAASGVYSIGVFDPGHSLAIFNCWFPDVAEWDPLLALLKDSRVSTRDKRRAIELIVELSERVPDEIRSRLAQDIDAVVGGRHLDQLGSRPIAGLAVALRVGTGKLAGSAADIAVAGLALGSEADRLDAATLLGRGLCEAMQPLLASFIRDGRAPVRSAAAYAVGRLASTAPTDFVVTLANVLVDDRGAVAPARLLAGLSRGAIASDSTRELAGRLLGHRSARLRRMAAQLRGS